MIGTGVNLAPTGIGVGGGIRGFQRALLLVLRPRGKESKVGQEGKVKGALEWDCNDTVWESGGEEAQPDCRDGEGDPKNNIKLRCLPPGKNPKTKKTKKTKKVIRSIPHLLFDLDLVSIYRSGPSVESPTLSSVIVTQFPGPGKS